MSKCYQQGDLTCLTCHTMHGGDVYVNPSQGYDFPTRWYVKPVLRWTLKSADALSAITVQPSATASLLVNGKSTKFSELKVGDPISIWVSQDRFSFYSAPGKSAGKVSSSPKPAK